MGYLHPIEASDANLDSINIEPANLLFDTTNQELFYDTHDNARIHITGIIFIDTEAKREVYENPLRTKLYIVRENSRPYLYDGQWLPITVQKEATYEIFYLDPTNGSDDNVGLSASTAVVSFAKIFSLYSSNKTYTILAFPGAYDAIYAYAKLLLDIRSMGTSPSDVVISGKCQFKNIDALTLTGLDLSGVSFINTNAVLKNCIIRNGAISVTDNSHIILDGCEINCTYTADKAAAVTADNGSVITAKNCTGTCTNLPIYSVSNGATINAISNTISLISSGATNTDNIISTAGKLYLDSDPVDASTQEYVEEMLSISEVY